MVTYQDGRFYYEDIISFKIPNGVQFFNCIGDEELVSGFTFCVNSKYNIIVSVARRLANPITTLNNMLYKIDVNDADILVADMGNFCGVMAIYVDCNFCNCEMILDVPEIDKLLRITFEFQVEEGENAKECMERLLKNHMVSEFFTEIRIENAG